MIDRLQAPLSQKVDKITFIQPQEMRLKNGWPVFLIEGGTEELLRIEFSFFAGSRFQDKKLAASFTNKMLREGTANRSSENLAEALDFYGAFFQAEANKDMGSVTLYVLNKHLEHVLPMVADVIRNAIFPEKELEVLRNKSRQQFLINEKKVGALASKYFPTLIFGEDHPYGSQIGMADFEAINKNDLQTYFKRYYVPANGSVVVAGKIPATLPQLLDTHFGTFDFGVKPQVKKIPSPSVKKTDQKVITKEGAVQSALRVGKVLFSKDHPDFSGMQILNTILGGYFGSRLMSNLREDKGYTYGISSSISIMQKAGCFYIATEVGVDVVQPAMREIMLEIRRLKDEKVPDDELNLVRNYLMGHFLRSTDGPFAQADRFNGIHHYGLDDTFYQRFINTILNITPLQLQELANRHLDENSLSQLIVGKW